jgi:hypothetical protein
MFPRYTISFLLVVFTAILCNEVFAVSLKKETDVKEVIDEVLNHSPIIPKVRTRMTVKKMSFTFYVLGEELKQPNVRIFSRSWENL